MYGPNWTQVCSHKWASSLFPLASICFSGPPSQRTGSRPPSCIYLNNRLHMHSTLTCKVLYRITSMLLNQPQLKIGQSCANSQQRIDRHANKRYACIALLCATLTPFETGSWKVTCSVYFPSSKSEDHHIVEIRSSSLNEEKKRKGNKLCSRRGN